jgi:hypothetical protein
MFQTYPRKWRVARYQCVDCASCIGVPASLCFDSCSMCWRRHGARLSGCLRPTLEPGCPSASTTARHRNCYHIFRAERKKYLSALQGASEMPPSPPQKKRYLAYTVPWFIAKTISHCAQERLFVACRWLRSSRSVDWFQEPCTFVCVRYLMSVVQPCLSISSF